MKKIGESNIFRTYFPGRKALKTLKIKVLYTEKNVYLGEQKILHTTTHILVCYDKAANTLPQQRFSTGFARY
jgi:hypothetical protein